MTSSLTASEQAHAVAVLLQTLRTQQPAATVELIETHLSFVLLAGTLVYKIKKAVNLGFVDFTTLALRRFYCDEELRLNRRLAPTLYLDAVPVTGTVAQPAFGGVGPVLDWAVRMRAFPQDGLWDRRAARGDLGPAHIDELVDLLVAFHGSAAIALPAGPYGQAESIRVPVQDTLLALDTLCIAAEERAPLAELNRWELRSFETLRSSFGRRLQDGWVRECHGDLHLGNVTMCDGKTTAFDCLEFSPALRWIDVMSEVAFMAMDLKVHGLSGLSNRFVNAYVERSGDPSGLPVLRYYMVYRALVRAKVAALRRDQLNSLAATPPAEPDEASNAALRYLDGALACSRHGAPTLMLTHGFSGSGKTMLTQRLLELCGAIRLRADVQRKRLFGLPAMTRSDEALKARLYSSQATDATHARMREQAALALGSGYNVILDATFLAPEHRQQARALANGLGVRFVIIDFRASAETLRRRVRQRVQRADDASEAGLAVLEDQLANAQPLHPQEQGAVFSFDAEPELDDADIAARWAPLLQSLGVAPA